MTKSVILQDGCQHNPLAYVSCTNHLRLLQFIRMPLLKLPCVEMWQRLAITLKKNCKQQNGVTCLLNIYNADDMMKQSAIEQIYVVLN